MATITAPAPAGGAQVLGRALSHLMGPGPSMASTAAGSGPSRQVTQPISLYSVGLADITDESFLRKARPVGWRYLVLDKGPIAVADLHGTADGASLAFNRLIRGAWAGRLEQATSVAERIYGKTPERYEVRILEIPSLYVSALWLHGKRDIFFPLYGAGAAPPQPVREDPSFVAQVVRAASARPSGPQGGASP